jgi:hypothetical protein
MSPEQLAELRNFFTNFEPRLPDAIALMFGRLLEAVPEAKQLFTGDPNEAARRYLRMLQQLAKLTRSSHLWPVQADTGTSTIPAIDWLGKFHHRMGLTRGHFDKMKAVLIECFREEDPELFTPQAEAALSFIFDVVSKTCTETRIISEEELARKNKLPHRDELEEIAFENKQPRHEEIEVIPFEPKSKEQQFWAWFAKEEELLFNHERDQNRAFGLLNAALNHIAPGVVFEFGPQLNGVRDFIISAGGIKAVFPAVEALAAAAPAMRRWNIIKFRPRRNPMMPLSLGGKFVDPEDVQFSLLSNGRELGLYLYFDDYTEAERAVWDQIGYQLLDEALGEYDVETKVGLIKFFSSQVQQEGRRYPVTRLPDIFDEQYTALTRMR